MVLVDAKLAWKLTLWLSWGPAKVNTRNIWTSGVYFFISLFISSRAKAGNFYFCLRACVHFPCFFANSD
jgi:hypothetical protein